MKDPGKVVIIGAGPTGLGAAHRLRELGVADFVVLEASQQPGGLATSYVDDCGFTWDVGGHVQFSHYRYYDEVLDRVMTRGWLEHERVAAVWIRGRWVPYPFQNNIHRLAAPDRDRILHDLEAIAATPPQTPAPNFERWIEENFGRTMADIFLIPYNRKVWGYPLASLGADWIGERVARVDISRIRRNVAKNQDDVGWGPNNRFRFPLSGGTGAIWSDLAATLPAGKVRYGTTVEEVDPDARRVRLDNGETLAFDHLVSTMPLDALCARTTPLDVDTEKAAASLLHSSVHVLGIGLRGDPPPDVQRKCWMYFPESNSPYYRVTVFTNYSPRNAPAGDGLWSLMAEVCESPAKPVDVGELRRWTLEALRQDGLIGRQTAIINFWHHREQHGYPTPSLNRDRALTTIHRTLEAKRIYSRGRFGAWKYEVSNQDHSFMQGVEVVDRLLEIGEEPTFDRPAVVNSGQFKTAAAQRTP